MQRRLFMGGILAGGALSLMPAGLLAASGGRGGHAIRVTEADLERLETPPEAWREVLDRDAWDVLFREKTEPAHSSPLDRIYDDGTYVCAACFLPLFRSETKFDSGTGWPSFYQPVTGHVDTRPDYKLFWRRTEYHCIRCGGHQGHVFDDGPEPTGQRWCNNGLALRFVPADEPLPALRG